MGDRMGDRMGGRMGDRMGDAMGVRLGTPAQPTCACHPAAESNSSRSGARVEAAVEQWRLPLAQDGPADSCNGCVLTYAVQN